MNSFNKNKEVIVSCKNYFKITNAQIYNDDKMSYKIIKIYKDYIFHFDIITKREKEKIVLIDNIIYKFVTDNRFNKEMTKFLSNLKVSSKITNLSEVIVNKMIEFFENYKDYYTRNIYIPRWI